MYALLLLRGGVMGAEGEGGRGHFLVRFSVPWGRRLLLVVLGTSLFSFLFFLFFFIAGRRFGGHWRRRRWRLILAVAMLPGMGGGCTRCSCTAVVV